MDNITQTQPKNSFVFNARFFDGTSKEMTIDIATPRNTEGLRGRKQLSILPRFVKFNMNILDGADRIEESNSLFEFIVDNIFSTFNSEQYNSMRDETNPQNWFTLENYIDIVMQYVNAYEPIVLSFLGIAPVETKTTTNESTKKTKE